MYAAEFEYHAPETLEEAIGLLQRHGDGAKLIAGGHSLIPLMKLRFAQPAHLVDVRRIAGLDAIREEPDGIAIGARVTHRQIERSEAIARRLPALAEAAAGIGDPLVRNRGTIGGSLAHADPAADLPAVVLALEAELRAAGPDGTRAIAANDFFVSTLTTALEPAEVLTEIRFPLPPPRSGGAYEKRPHPASRYAIVGVAARITLDGDGAVEAARLAITGIAPVATRAAAAEEALAGRAPDTAVIADAAARITEGIEVLGDLQGPAEYRTHLAAVHARRAIERAVERARAA